MKKLLLLTFAILFSTAIMAQNRAAIISESFDNNSIPEGWSVMGVGESNWVMSNSDKAGGTPYEIKLNWNPIISGVSRLVTHAVDLTDISQVTITFKHYLDHHQDTNTIGVATTSDNGETWNIGWTQDYSATGQYSVNHTFSTPDMGKQNVRFCIFFTGNTFYINDWYFDDITVFSVIDFDLGISSIDIDNIILEYGDIPVDFTVTNYGNTPITSFEASYQLEGYDMITETFDVNIESLESQTFTFETPVTLLPGIHNLTLNIISINGKNDDDDSNNNSLSKTINTSLGTTQKIPMIEHFSSSTCGPCISVNNEMATLTDNNPGKYTYTKYAMNWPVSGDPYYTNEGGTRRTYYGVSAVPQTFLDGADQGFTSVTQNALDQQYNTPAFADIRGSYTIDGTTITITADFMSYVDMANVNAFISVNEKTTHDNTGSNGETEFHHIMMKMLPDANGSTISINAGEYIRLEFTHDMSTTHVEEMDDLEVSVWLQNLGTKEMYNSHFMYENTEHPYPVQNLQMTENEDNTMTISYEAPEAGNPTGYNVYLNAELVAENTTDLEYTFPSESGNYYVAEACAVYGEDMTSVRTVVGVLNTMSIEDNMVENHCTIYPNPANDHVNIINNTEMQTINIFNCVGTLVDRIEVRESSFELNTSKYNTGIYFMNIMNANGHSASKKLVITH